VHLKSVTLKGFKSFPDRERLEFGPGVSVIVGPNGSGKSNVTDAVLWAMGEQSPVAVRGQSMQDVIFGGGAGQQARSAAEVEIVIDNGDGGLALDLSEISIQRRLDRTGEGEYRLNGARCRLVDVLEVLSDTGLGKEGHSVVSQGRVEAVVTSKPRDRRLLIEEASGLGKHRKRRRRAQLKLARTQENLDRALDVEREARGRLRPLKRQAEAAELHARLERQSLQARWTLSRHAVRDRLAELATAEEAAAQARARREEAEAALGEVATRRERAEEALARRSERREALSARSFAARGAAERVQLRLEGVRAIAELVSDRLQRTRSELEGLAGVAPGESVSEADAERLAALEGELERLHGEREQELEQAVADLAERSTAAAAALAERDVEVQRGRDALHEAEKAADAQRAVRREAERAVEAARRRVAEVGAETAAANHFLRTHAGVKGAGTAARALADDLQVDAGYERALAAALGGRLRAAVVPDVRAGADLLDRAGPDGGSALVAGRTEPADRPSTPPAPGAQRLLERIGGPEHARALAATLLGDTWVVDDLATVASGFSGVAVTRSGRAWFGAWRELRQAPDGGEERVLAARNRRDELLAVGERVASEEQEALARVEAASAAVNAADAARDKSDADLREALRDRDRVAEEARRADWHVEQRRRTPDEGPGAVRRAQLEAELVAERRLAERAEQERAERERRLEHLHGSLERDERLAPAAGRLAEALGVAEEAIAGRVAQLGAELDDDREAGDRLAAELRSCAQEEAGLQASLKERAEAVTTVEVGAQRIRDATTEAQAELSELATRLELEASPAEGPLDAEEAEALEQRIVRLARRREQLGPVNPLARDEYEDARARVEDLEAQREDLETALRELRSLISETDRQIRETFEETFDAAARNFEELAGELFPGGRGRLRLVREEPGPRPVLGGQAPEPGEERAEEPREEQEEDTLGVEIEITPSGKATKRLTLLSGGEKSLTALAFLFAVFLARPCPFYILDEVEAALDDVNIDRFLAILRRYSQRAQFIVVTHQKRTMEAADTLYGVSMGDNGVSKVISRRLPREAAPAAAAGAA